MDPHHGGKLPKKWFQQCNLPRSCFVFIIIGNDCCKFFCRCINCHKYYSHNAAFIPLYYANDSDICHSNTHYMSRLCDVFCFGCWIGEERTVC